MTPFIADGLMLFKNEKQARSWIGDLAVLSYGAAAENGSWHLRRAADICHFGLMAFAVAVLALVGIEEDFVPSV